MTKTTLSLLAAGVLALAGAANAQTFTAEPMRNMGETTTLPPGEATQLMTPLGEQVIVDTHVLGAGPAVVTTPGYVIVRPMSAPVYSYDMPATVTTYSWSAPPMVDQNPHYHSSLFHGE